MPLVISELPKYTDMKSMIGKKLVYVDQVPNVVDKDYPITNVVFSTQLPENALVLKQDVDKNALTGAAKEGLFPIIINDNNIILGR